ncbi:MAG: type II 3-dehydroquinate dehydratase [Oscillospiraceae bacterium]
MKKILVINGPNINMLGIREKHIYGNESYEDLVRIAADACAKNGFECECFQSNHEGDLVDRIQAAYHDGTDGIVINPAAFTHTSIALLDALKAVDIPAVEVHISDLNSREDFRQLSYAGMACFKTIIGQGLQGYALAVEALRLRLSCN